MESHPDLTPKRHWAHAPVHHFSEAGTYIVTGSTLYKKRLWNTPQKLDVLEREFFALADEHGIQLQAWALMCNHYHTVFFSDEPDRIPQFFTCFHRDTASLLNQMDGTPGRRVWYQFYDTRLTLQKSYLARLSYVHRNPVKHKLVAQAEEYQWCSASWLRDNASSAFRRTLESFTGEGLNIWDDFD